MCFSFEMVSDKHGVVVDVEADVAGNVWNGVIVIVVRAKEETQRSRKPGSGLTG